MEIALFNRQGKKSTSTKTKPLKDLIAMESPTHMLANSKRKTLLDNLMQSSACEQARFDNVCLTLIHTVANYCQRLPETANNYYATPGGLLDHRLHRTEAALQLFRHFIEPEDSATLSEAQQLWMYALLTASMLQGLGKLQIDYHLDLFDRNGQLLKSWDPLLESMTTVGDYYQYTFLQNHDDALRCRLNLLFARQLMPASGFSWIASNPEVLATWLALLNEDTESAGTLGAIFERAEAISIQRYVSAFITRGASAAHTVGRPNRMATFSEVPAESVLGKEQLLGAEFLQWLMTSLSTGHIPVNKVPLFMVIQGGMLMSVELFKRFIQTHTKYNNWQAVQQAFLALGLHRLAADGTIISRIEQPHHEHILSGIVVDNAILPERVHVYDAVTNKSTEVSTIELMHSAKSNGSAGPLPHLSVSGQWGRFDAKSNTLTSSFKSRG